MSEISEHRIFDRSFPLTIQGDAEMRKQILTKTQRETVTALKNLKKNKFETST